MPVMYVSIITLARIVAASSWSLRTARWVACCGYSRRSSARRATSAPDASISGHGSHPLARSRAARRTLRRLGRSGTGRAESTRIRTSGQTAGHSRNRSPGARVVMAGRLRASDWPDQRFSRVELPLSSPRVHCSNHVYYFVTVSVRAGGYSSALERYIWGGGTCRARYHAQVRSWSAGVGALFHGDRAGKEQAALMSESELSG